MARFRNHGTDTLGSRFARDRADRTTGTGNRVVEVILLAVIIGTIPQRSSAFEPVLAWTAESNQTQAFLGMSVAGAGDTNGDGFADVIVGSPWYSDGQEQEGAAFVYCGSASGLSSSPDWTGDIGQSWSWFGEHVAGAGDVNGDGYDDVLIGAFGFDNGDDMEGGAFLYHGSSAGLSPTPDWTAEGDAYRAQFGGSVAAAGDVNGDGYADVLVGAKLLDTIEQDGGGAFLYLGGASGLSSTPEWFFGGDQFDAHVGASVQGAGDVNADGYDDILVGATGYDLDQFDEGAAFLFLGAAGGPSPTPSWQGSIGQFEAGYGSALAGLGDINADGYADFAVGASAYDGNQQDEGGVFVYLGSADGPATTPDWILTVGQYEARIHRVDGAGDVNGDGFDDVIIGGMGVDAGDEDEGAAYLYLGSATGLPATPTWSVEGDQYQALLGHVGGAGDVNGDGADDLVIGAPFFDAGQADEGMAFVYYGETSTVAVSDVGLQAWTTLSRPSPNPARSHVSVFMHLQRPSVADVRVLDVSGRVVRRLSKRAYNPGRHRIDWDLRSDRGTTVAPGVYFIALDGAHHVRARSIVVR